MAEVFAAVESVVTYAGREFVGRVCGGEMAGLWEGWIEFTSMDDGEIIRTSRETTQPNRAALAYWAGGLTATYFEGAVARALNPRSTLDQAPAVTAYDGASAPPRAALPPPAAARVAESILDPFSVYEKGEPVLRRQLNALAAWHLVNIIRVHALSAADGATLDGTPAPILVDLIVEAVRSRSGR